MLCGFLEPASELLEERARSNSSAAPEADSAVVKLANTIPGRRDVCRWAPEPDPARGVSRAAGESMTGFGVCP